MSYEVEIIADSIAEHGARIVTYKLKYPRMIHSEFMTHRAFSRNASSTRAIPTAKMIEWVESDPAMPIYWGKNQKGMSADEELSPLRQECALQRWMFAKHDAIIHAKCLMETGVHKQIASRILEPFAHINVVATATSEGWMNYFALRCHKDAQPEMRHLAVLMAKAYRDSTPKLRSFGITNCHLPFVSDEEVAAIPIEFNGISPDSARLSKAMRLSVARCARVSYLTHDGKPSPIEADLALAASLESNGHWSPFEHQAWPNPNGRVARSGNFVGWHQYRQSLAKSVHTTFDFASL